MKKLSDEQQREQLRQRIIGLGERSLKKSYYPELQKRIRELEQSNEALAREIHERRKTEELKEKLERQLRQSQKMEAIGTLAGGIAHDFNNILSAIIGYSELGEIHLNGDPVEAKDKVRQDLNGILRSAQRAKELVARLLSFSSQQSSEHVPVNLASVVDETCGMLRALIPTTIALEHHFRIARPMVLADATQLHQVIMNLCTNAYHAMRDRGGTITLEIDRNIVEKDDIILMGMVLPIGQYIVLRITDTGCGMSKSLIERIFDPYFTTKTTQGGTGLGLSVVHGIVNQHSGHITVYSERDVGTSFHIYLPELVEHGASVRSRTASPKIGGGTERLLVVDDELDLLTTMEGTLRHLGYNVTTAGSPHSALDQFMHSPQEFDLLVTDMNMPEMSGARLIEKLRAIRPDLPVILCTGFSESMDAERTAQLGASRYLMKPATQRQLNEAIRSLLDDISRESA